MEGSRIGSIIVIAGATATGKTSLALELAARLGAEVVSADSRQVYHYLDIGTAKPTLEERAAVPHHLIEVAYPDQPYSVAHFRQQAEQALHDIESRGLLPMVVGGTAQYLRALIDRFEVPPRDNTLRAWLNRADAQNPASLDWWLAALDPVSAKVIDSRNRRRVVRAVEVTMLTGEPFSQAGRRTSGELPAIWIGLRLERKLLHERIAARVQSMLEAGWLQEVRTLLAMGYSLDLPSMSASGYAELGAVLRGELDLDVAVQEIRQSIHAFVRHQETWLRRDNRIHWFDAAFPDLADQVMAHIEPLVHNQAVS
ncbi:MAG TPA: tRNA (adenosine(37)-N6)-dimethylallyltransferase MiaA [Chloroflexota bacterium]